MQPADREELASWLLRNARHFYLQVLAQSMGSGLFGPGRVPEMLFQSAAQWMAETPLVDELAHRAHPAHPVHPVRAELAEAVGPFWSAEFAAARLSLSDAVALEALASAGGVLLVPTSDGHSLAPKWQFSEVGNGKWVVAPGVLAMLKVLEKHDRWAVALLMSVPAPELGDCAPRDMLQGAGGASHVADLARLARVVASEWR